MEVQPAEAQVGTKSLRIPIDDIDAIEPFQGKHFELRYSKEQTSYLSGKKKQTKTIGFESRYLIDIMDCFEQVKKMSH